MSNVRDELLKLAEDEYRKFSANLLPGINNILGVRIPSLRKIAKNIAKTNWKEYIAEDNEKYFEEIMLHGLIIGYLNEDIDTVLKYVSEFIPKINNWSVCDSFCSSLKITKKNKDKVWEFLNSYFQSENEFEVRFAVVMLKNYYINDKYISDVLKILDNIKHEGYYVKMAVAWTISICYINMPDVTMKYLKNNNLDDFTYNKSLQKIIESLSVSKEAKNEIKKMKRKIIRI